MKNKKLLIIASVLVAAGLCYYIWYINQGTTYPYTVDGVTFYEDGSYSYSTGINIVTNHPDGTTTVTSDPNYVSDFVPNPNPYIPQYGYLDSGTPIGIGK